SPTVTTTASLSYTAKLAPPSTLTLYLPGGSPTTLYRPASSDVTLRAAPVSALVIVSFAPRTASPCGSLTVPESDAVSTCALVAPAHPSTSTHSVIHANTP